jgi:3-oxoacyl-[acyl-carrier protein] reductase
MEETMSRVVLITGGSRGIGLATAKRFAAMGDKVAVTYNSSAPSGDFLAVKCDVTNESDVERAFTEDGLLLRMKEHDFTSVVDTNLAGAFRVCKRATQSMLRARKGRIILVSSVVGLLGQAGQANYAASKAGLVGLARSLAREFGSRSITVNVVAPGPVDTDMTRTLGDEILQAIADLVPLARIATADEIAGAIAFLASTDAAYITGAVLPVDGGLGMGH